jgi:hypothetical protein
MRDSRHPIAVLNLELERKEKIRQFETGATRDVSSDKPDYEGYLHPLVLEEYGRYMLSHQRQQDGTLRTSDNWQKGMDRKVYLKSLLRHVFDLWKLERGVVVTDLRDLHLVTPLEACMGIMFNVMGFVYETLTNKFEISRQIQKSPQDSF